MAEYIFLSDVEGPLANPGQDNAKDILAFMESKGMITSQERSDIEGPADNTDDNRYRREKFLRHTTRARWSTGTTPGTVQCYAAMNGLTDDGIYEIATDKFLLNPGVAELLEFVKQKCVRVGLATTAHSSVSLTIGRNHGIPSSYIWSLGYRPSPEKLREFDEHPDVLAEIKERSIIRKLAPYSSELRRFVPEWTKINVEWDKANSQGDTDTLERLEQELSELFRGRSYPPKFLRRMDEILQSKTCLMGAHQKGQVVFELSRYGIPIVVGDSIVDELMILYAQDLGGVGIAVNDTNPDSLLGAAINIATPDMQAVRDVAELIMAKRYDTERANAIVAKYGAKVFSLYDYRNNPAEVMETHRQAKDQIKVIYREWIESKINNE